MVTCPVPNNISTTSSTAVPSVESRSHFRISRRAVVTVTSSRSCRSWASCLAAPIAAASPA